jgi:hypothetical protein
MDITPYFTSENISRVFTIECFQKDRETFLDTHYSLSFAFKEAGSGNREKQMTEEALLNQWREGLQKRRGTRQFIRPFVIWGAPGTGKTELCRWLEEKIPDQNKEYFPIRVSKRDLIMGGILGVAKTFTGKEVNIGERLLSKYGGQPPETFFKYTLGSLEDKKGKDVQKGIERLKITAADEASRDFAFDFLASQMKRNIEERVRNVETTESFSAIETPLEFFTPRDATEQEKLFHSNQIFIRMNIPQVNKALYKKLTSFFFEIEDVKKLIFEFIKEKNQQGKIPVIIFDDVTFLGDLVDDFIGVITDISASGQKSEYTCDFVIGTTTDFYNRKFKDALYSTAKERITEIKLSPEGTENLNANWLMGDGGKNHFLHFAYKYLTTARNEESSESKVFSPFTDDQFNYYPFTKDFLINLYDRILSDRNVPETKGVKVALTPRYVIQVLRNALVQSYGTAQPPSSFVDHSLIQNTLDFYQMKEAEKEKWKDVLLAAWWYGKRPAGSKKTQLPLALFKELGDFKLPKTEWKNGDQISIPVDAVIDDEIIGPGPDPHPVNPADRQLRDIIRRWCKGEEAEVSTETLKKGFNKAVSAVEGVLAGDQKFTNLVNRHSSREGLVKLQYDARGNKACAFFIGDERQENIGFSLISTEKEKQILDKVEKNRLKYLTLTVDGFFSLYKIGNSKPNSIEYKENLKNFLLENSDDLSNILEHQHLSIKQSLESELKVSVEAYVLAAYLFTSRMFKSAVFLTPIQNTDDIVAKSKLPNENLSNYWDPRLKSAVSNVMFEPRLYEYTESLFIGMFSLRGSDNVTLNIIDRPLLEKAWSEIKEDPLGVLLKPVEINEQFILTGTEGKRVKDLIAAIKKLIRACEEQNSPLRMEGLKNTYDLLDQLQDPEKLRETLETVGELLNEKYRVEKRSIDQFQRQLKNVDPNKILPRYKEILAYHSKKKNLKPHEEKITAAGIQSYYTWVTSSEEYRLASALEQLIYTLEKRFTESDEYIITTLTPKLQEFIAFKEELL